MRWKDVWLSLCVCVYVCVCVCVCVYVYVYVYVCLCLPPSVHPFYQWTDRRRNRQTFTNNTEQPIISLRRKNSLDTKPPTHYPAVAANPSICGTQREVRGCGGGGGKRRRRRRRRESVGRSGLRVRFLKSLRSGRLRLHLIAATSHLPPPPPQPPPRPPPPLPCSWF